MPSTKQELATEILCRKTHTSQSQGARCIAMKLSISKFLLYTSWILAHTEVVESKLEAAVILPHGDFSLDPSLLDPHTDARAAA